MSQVIWYGLILFLGTKTLFYLACTAGCFLYCRVRKRKGTPAATPPGSGRLGGPAAPPNGASRTWVRNCGDGMVKFLMEWVSQLPAHWLRMVFYRRVFCVEIGPRVVIYKGVIFRSPYRIQIDAGSIIGDNCWLDGREGLYIGRNVNLSSEVRIWTGQHQVHSDTFAYAGQPVRIEDYAWVSSNVVLLPGVTVGRGAVAAAGAVVTQDIEPQMVAAGVPAKMFGKRKSSLLYEFSGEHDWFY